MSAQKDWTKFVTVDPPAYVAFKQIDGEERPCTVVSLINKSEGTIMFKVKTTNPKNYLVRPN